VPVSRYVRRALEAQMAREDEERPFTGPYKGRLVAPEPPAGMRSDAFRRATQKGKKR
jgi:hypothetical protein